MGPGSPKRLIATLAVAILAAVCASFLFQPESATSIRRKAQSGYLVISEADLPGQIESCSVDGRILAIRQPADNRLMTPAILEALRFIGDSPCYLGAEAAPRERRVLAPLLAFGGMPALSAPLAPDSSETLDESGRPLRWRMPDNVLASYNVPRVWPFQTQAQKPENPRLVAALGRLAPSRKAGDYRELVDTFARRYNLNANLVMAIIHSESNFSPGLVSSKSAMGLMQLLPSTASDEVHRFLYGRRGQVSFEQLSVPEINIRYGTAYLHILNNRYFASVRDSRIREACVIASYNMGPNGFLRLYGPTPAAAIERINSMSVEEFHADLPKRLPVRETRFYVEKVRRMKQHYAGMQ